MSGRDITLVMAAKIAAIQYLLGSPESVLKRGGNLRTLLDEGEALLGGAGAYTSDPRVRERLRAVCKIGRNRVPRPAPAFRGERWGATSLGGGILY